MHIALIKSDMLKENTSVTIKNYIFISSNIIYIQKVIHMINKYATIH